jgi:simple sugar transport system permease protein
VSVVNPTIAASSAPIALEKAVVRNPKAPIALGIFSVIALGLFVGLARTGTTTFRLSTETDVIQLPPIVADVAFVCTLFTVLMFVIASISAVLTWRARKTPLWLMLMAVFWGLAWISQVWPHWSPGADRA